MRDERSARRRVTRAHTSTNATTSPRVPAPVSSVVRVRHDVFERVVVATPWLTERDDLAHVMARHLLPHARPGDVAIVSEKVAVVTSGRAIDARGLVPGPLARRLAARVRPTDDSRGLSIPEKMQYVVDEVGAARVVAAALASALTRPLGVHGAFYVVAGRVARAVDGMRPPFDGVLLPPLAPREAASLARSLGRRVGLTVAIVDVNDRGGSIRAVSDDRISPRLLLRVLADNPLGQRDRCTPMGLVRRAGTRA